MPVPNTFANATTSIPLSQLDQNFATAITLGNTAIQLGNTVTTLNNMTLANVTVSTGNVSFTQGTIGGNVVINTTGTANTGNHIVTGTLSVSGAVTQGGALANYAANFRDGTVGGSCYLQITTNASGNAGTDGFVWGLDTASPPNAYLSQKENANLYLQANSATVATVSSTGLLVGTTSSTAGYALKVGGASANILIQADSPNGATLLCDSSAAGSKGAFFGHITTVSQAQVRCGASGGVYLSDGATSWTAISDERQKTDLVPITDALVKVSSLRAVTGRYVWDEKRRAFLIAQEVQQVLPEAVDVADDADGTLGLAYTDVIPLLVASIKELNAKVSALESKNAQV